MTEDTRLRETIPASVNSTEGWSDEQLAGLRLFVDYPSELLDFAAVCCIIFMLLGIPGNLITVWSLARYKKVRNATAIFIINMSISDFLFCCINFPLAATTFWTRRWTLGVFMCRFFPFARFLLAAVTIFTVLAITINRYIMISHPRIYPKLYTTRNIGIIITATWIISAVILIPTWAEVWGRYGMDPHAGFCVVLPDHRGHSPMKILFIAAFIIPFITICACYTRIICVVRKTTANSRGTVNRPKSEPEDTSFATSTEEKSQVSETASTAQRGSQLDHPRVQSLRPSSTPRVKFPPEIEDTSIPRSTSVNKIKKVMKRKQSQIIQIATPTSKDKRLLTMVTAIIIVFFVCHLPITIIKVFSESSPPPSAIVCSYLLRYLTTCINPFIYVVMSYEYRKAYKKAFPFCNKNKCVAR